MRTLTALADETAGPRCHVERPAGGAVRPCELDGRAKRRRGFPRPFSVHPIHDGGGAPAGSPLSRVLRAARRRVSGVRCDRPRRRGQRGAEPAAATFSARVPCAAPDGTRGGHGGRWDAAVRRGGPDPRSHVASRAPVAERGSSSGARRTDLPVGPGNRWLAAERHSSGCASMASAAGNHLDHKGDKATRARTHRVSPPVSIGDPRADNRFCCLPRRRRSPPTRRQAFPGTWCGPTLPCSSTRATREREPAPVRQLPDARSRTPLMIGLAPSWPTTAR